MIDMNKYKIGVSGLTKEIYLYRMGKDKNWSLDKRKIESEVFAAIIEYLLGENINTPSAGASQSMRFGDKYFRVTATVITEDEFMAERSE